MKELEQLEALLQGSSTADGFFLSVRKADLKVVCQELRKRLPSLAGSARQFEDDKKLIERINKFGKNLNDIEQGILETSLSFVEDGRELTDKMRAVMRRVDDTKVG